MVAINKPTPITLPLHELRERAQGDVPRGSLDRSPPTLEELFKSYRLGTDPEAAKTLYGRLSPYVYAVAIKHDLTHESAEEVTQEAMTKFFLKADKFTPGAKVLPWLSTIATNTAIDHQRRNNAVKRSERSISSFGNRRSFESIGSYLLETKSRSRSKTAQQIVIAAEDREFMDEAVSRFETKYRDVDPNKVKLLDMYLDKTKYGAMAKELGVALGTVKSRLHHIKLELREILSEVELEHRREHLRTVFHS